MEKKVVQDLGSLTDIYDHVINLPMDEIRKSLAEYVDNNLLSFIEKNNVVDLRRLYAFLLWLREKVEIAKPSVGRLDDPEEGFLTLEVYIHCKNKEEWREIAKKVKEEMNREGFSDIAKSVLLVCVEWLQEVLH